MGGKVNAIFKRLLILLFLCLLLWVLPSYSSPASTNQTMDEPMAAVATATPTPTIAPVEISTNPSAWDDPGWYANPVRNRRVISMKKMPFDIKGYAQAKTREEKMRSYCQCPLIRDHLDEVNPLFCSCGAGWFRQLWEGILGRSVTVEMVKTVAKGDDCCLVHVKI